jgi:hypothetical protein
MMSALASSALAGIRFPIDAASNVCSPFSINSLPGRGVVNYEVSWYSCMERSAREDYSCMCPGKEWRKGSSPRGGRFLALQNVAPDTGRRGNVPFAISDCILISHLAEGLHVRCRVLHHFRQIVEV